MWIFILGNLSIQLQCCHNISHFSVLQYVNISTLYVEKNHFIPLSKDKLLLDKALMLSFKILGHLVCYLQCCQDKITCLTFLTPIISRGTVPTYRRIKVVLIPPNTRSTFRWIASSIVNAR